MGGARGGVARGRRGDLLGQHHGQIDSRSVPDTRLKERTTKRSDSPHSFKNFLKARDVIKDESNKIKDKEHM